ncbi:EpsG family protein [Pseudomonas qingdaonensis]|uniref:EpsG family protein n=1 Tax=Pseudomonas qingdaonensis TaxID=2056231 RepID=UPI001F47232B|nr:EpsG family protein [Pseudomonas qingdaonensis]
MINVAESAPPRGTVLEARLKRHLYTTFILIIALIYGWWLASLPLDVFKDRINYLNYVEYSALTLQFNFSQSWLGGLVNEPVWLLINASLANVFSPETSLRIIIGGPATLTAYMLLRSNPRYFFWLLLFMFLPQLIKNHIVHLRQGMAISIFLAGWFATRWPFRYFLILLSPFIHASFFFIIFFMLLCYVLNSLRFSSSLRNLVFVTIGLLFGVAVGGIASFLGARQGQAYDFSSVGVSGLGFIFWSGILLLFLVQGRAFLRDQALAVAIVVFYLSTYFLNEVAGRIFESGFILVLLAGLSLPQRWRLLFVALICLYGLIGYAGRLGQSWLGFGY